MIFLEPTLYSSDVGCSRNRIQTYQTISPTQKEAKNSNETVTSQALTKHDGTFTEVYHIILVKYYISNEFLESFRLF